VAYRRKIKKQIIRISAECDEAIPRAERVEASGNPARQCQGVDIAG